MRMNTHTLLRALAFFCALTSMNIGAQNYEAQMLVTITPIAPQFEYSPEEQAKHISHFKLHEYIQLIPLTQAGKDMPKAMSPDIPSNDMILTGGSTRSHIKKWLINRYQTLLQWSKKKTMQSQL